MSGAHRREDLDAIRARSLELARDRLGLVFKNEGRSWKALCPFHRESTPSFDYRDDTRTFRCFGCGWAGGDIFALYTAMNLGATFPETVTALGGSTASGAPAAGARSFRDLDDETAAGPPTLQPAAPDDTPEPRRHPRCVGRWSYTDSDGRRLGYQDRIDDEAGKRFASWRWNESAATWEPRAIAKPRPLYRLVDLTLRPDAPVLVCEGEKAADAACEAFPGHVCTTSMGGSGAARSTDWTPIRGRIVRLWPDNDDAGHRYACEVAAILAAMETALLVVRPSPSMPAGWDLADPLPIDTSAKDLHRLLSEARSLEGKQSMSTGKTKRTFADAEQAAESDGALPQEAVWPTPEPLTEQLLPIATLDADALLPVALRAWVKDEADRMPCAPDYIAAAAVVELGSLIGTRCAVAPKASDDWTVTPNVWGGAVGPPAVKKSPAIGAALAPLEGLAAKARETHKQEMALFEMEELVHDAEQKAFEGRIKNAAKKSTARKPATGAGQVPTNTDGDDDNDPTAVAEEMRKHRESWRPAPTLRRYKTNDSTVPKLEELLSENPTGMLVVRDELVGLLAGWDREGHQGEREWYLEAWNGDQAKDTDRIARGSINVPRVCVSIFGGIQPDKLAGYLEQATSLIANDGMVQRFQVLVYPDPVGWEWRDRRPDLDAREAASAVFNALADFDPVSWGAEPGRNGKPPFFRLSRGALAVVVAYSTTLHLVTIPAETEPVVQQHLAKYDKLLPALALIFHLVDCAAGGMPGPVSEQAARMAARWCDYLQTHARRCYGLLDGGGGHPARLLLDKIKARKLADGFTARDVVRKQWRGLTKDSAVHGALSRLEAAHWLRGKDTEGPGYPTTKYRINPRINAPAEAERGADRKTGMGREDTDVTDAKGGFGSSVSECDGPLEFSSAASPP